MAKIKLPSLKTCKNGRNLIFHDSFGALSVAYRCFEFPLRVLKKPFLYPVECFLCQFVTMLRRISRRNCQKSGASFFSTDLLSFLSLDPV